MKRRDFLKKAAVGAAAASAAPAVLAQSKKRIRWRMATSWPKAFDIIFGGAESVAARVKAMTGGQFEIIPYAGGELVGGLEVFDAVSQGTVQMGHTASYYYIGKDPALAFDAAVPFGLTFRQQNAWFYQGGGREAMREIFAEHNIVNFPAGNTGVQMGGWFRKEVNSLDDLKGLKMRIPGLGGKVMSRLGVTVQVMAGAEIYPALERGVIDATEWVGPYDDEKAGFYKVAPYYYYPGWWEPAPTLSLYINQKAWDSLPKEYQEIVASAAAESNLNMMSEYDTHNSAALKRLVEKGTKIREYSTEILEAARKESLALYDELSAENARFKKIYADWRAFKTDSDTWFSSNETSYARFNYK
ncbi:TRAP transporter substrate-binding protein [Sedimenticola thiotaurini]|uniref:ABC transporter substrate-binding protein n=1 Tax=Sedimenticola thiotaurini TaxID=1543721 RepID=A0A0F7K2M2_9GAMM|nr:TRAP transporter substrate-binding protein [Sedimenticola thiotaurini]AKH21173.1 ABC transporter substrate-binding protein [Sedimenticola thiotaurini]